MEGWGKTLLSMCCQSLEAFQQKTWDTETGDCKLCSNLDNVSRTWLPNLQCLRCFYDHSLIALSWSVVGIASTRCQQIQSWLSGARLTAFLSIRVKMSCSLSRPWMSLTPSSQVSHAFHRNLLMSVFASTAMTGSYLGSAHCGQWFTSHAAQVRNQHLPWNQMCQRTPFAREELMVAWSVLLYINAAWTSWIDPNWPVVLFWHFLCWPLLTSCIQHMPLSLHML